MPAFQQVSMLRCKQIYVYICTFSFEIEENSQSDTRCCITTLWW